MRRLQAFFFGVIEFRSSFTRRYHDWKRARAYDSGRDWAHRLTLRRYDH